jgi:3D (Asp-Asp-Asp) domain-containing protein
MVTVRTRSTRWFAPGIIALLVGAMAIPSVQAEEGHQVEVIYSGHRQTLITKSPTVRAVLLERRIFLGPFDEVTPPVDTQITHGMLIEVRRAIPVILIADGQESRIYTVGRTPREIFARAGIEVGPKDRVFPGIDDEVAPRQRVRVIRIREQIVTERRTVPPPLIQRLHRDAFPARYRVVSPGRAGRVEVVYRVRFADGQAVKRTRLDRRVLQPSQPRIVHLGHAYVPSRAALRRLPSMLVEATAYAPFYGPGVGGITFTGMRAQRGVIAVDPRVIPLGTIVYVEGYGTAIAADTGGAIRGRRIDVCLDTPREAYQWGRRWVRIWILGR